MISRKLRHRLYKEQTVAVGVCRCKCNSSNKIARNNWDDTHGLKYRSRIRVNIARGQNSRRKEPDSSRPLLRLGVIARVKFRQSIQKPNSWRNSCRRRRLSRGTSVFRARRRSLSYSRRWSPPFRFAKRVDANETRRGEARLTHRRIIEVRGRRDFQDIIHSTLVRRVLQRNGRRQRAHRAGYRLQQKEMYSFMMMTHATRTRRSFFFFFDNFSIGFK